MSTSERETALARRLLTFAKERFDPLSHLAMICLFVAFHVVAATPGKVTLPVAGMIVLFIGTFAFFFKLRAYDEIKDYEVDLKYRPERPLARGLVSHKDLAKVIVSCIAIEIACFSYFGVVGATSIVIAIAYSLLMFKEFFIGKYLRPLLTTYAVTHTFVGGLLSFGIFSSLHGTFLWEESAVTFKTAFAGWCLFNIFEFGRKTFCTSEERPEIESYSKIFGRYGAVALVLLMAAAASFLFAGTLPEASLTGKWILWGATLLTGIVGGLYAAVNRPPFGGVYRAASSAFIVVIYGGLFFVFL